MSRATGTRRAWTLVLAAAMSLGLVAAACGDDDVDTAVAADDGGDDAAADDAADDGGDDASADDSAVVAAEPEPEPEPAEVTGDEAMASQDGGGGDTGADSEERQPIDQSDQLASLGRSIIFVANLTVEVDDVAFSASQAKARMAGLGGLVFGENTTVGERTTTTLEFKVPPGEFQEALRRLEGLGTLKSQQVTADDVTERVVDLQSRIATAEASVVRLREFLAEAVALEDIAALERELLERETNLETLRGQLRTIQDQVDLATIFLSLTEAAPPPIEATAEYAVTFTEGADDGAGCPGAAELEVDEGEPFTVCVQVINTGTDPMGQIQIRDNRLDLEPRDFTFVDRADERPLAPGESLVAFASREAPGQGRSKIVVTADVLDADGQPLRIGVEFTEPERATITFVEDDSLPGFRDSLEASWDVLVTLAGVAVVLAGVLLPFVWLPVIAWLAYRWWQGRRAEPATAAERAG